MTTFLPTIIEEAYNSSTLKNNRFEKAVRSLARDSYTDGSNTTYCFDDGYTLDCDSLDPFRLHYATLVSGDLSLVLELKAA